MVKLEEYRIEKSMTYRQLAEHLKIDHTTAYKYCKGQRTPSLNTAIKIREATKGEVGIYDWKPF